MDELQCSDARCTCAASSAKTPFPLSATLISCKTWSGQYILMDLHKKRLIKCGARKKLNSGGQEHVHHHFIAQL